MRVRALSDAQLARMTGLNRSSICRYRTGRVTPRLNTAALIAVTLGLPITDLVEVPR